MSLSGEILALLKKELRSEMVSGNQLAGSLLYLFSILFVCYLALNAVSTQVWNAMLWILIIFVVANQTQRGFDQENGRQRLLVYSLARPQAIILSKLIHYGLRSVVFAVVILIAWATLFAHNVESWSTLFILLFLGTLGLNNVFVLNSSIAAGTDNQATVLAILSFPVLLPILLTTVKASIALSIGDPGGIIPNYLGILALLNLITLALSYLLFPYLWRY